MRTALILVTVTALSVALTAGSRYAPGDVDDSAYWVWRWSDLALVDPTDSLLLYQGDFQLNGDSAAFVKRGVDPYSLPDRSEVGVLVRLYDIDDAELFADQVTYLVQQWRQHEVGITEIQLDYDCPSYQLSDYARFVDQARSRLAEQGVKIPFSATGLLTWLSDDPQGLERLADSVTYIAFQLYDAHDPLDNLDGYFASLQHYKHPYKIGISTSEKFDDMEYPRSENHQGKLVFLNVVQ